RYEAHHKGVKIKDSALVAAAELSHRYIADRFLPDKAIDLMDEATSRIAMVLQRVASVIDEVQRRLVQLELAARPLAEETEEHAKERLHEIEEESARLRKKLADLRKQWEAEKSGVGSAQELRKQLDEVQLAFDQAAVQIKERQGTGQPVGEDLYQQLYELDVKRKALQQRIEQEGTEKGGEAAKTGKRLLRREVGPEEIAEVVSAWTGIPVTRLVETERAKLLVLEERLHQRVVGQEEAVEAVSDAVRRSRAGLQDPNRPIGSFIFLGPTGVGKTELCKALAEVLFDDENAMVRIDMSEFMEKHTVARLIGAPPGYVGYEEGGLLTEAVRRRPYSVVLLDEMEKAHRDVFNVLLQVLDDGRLTDSLGHTVDFTNTIVVMTSNVGSQAIQEITKEGGSEQEVRDAVKEALQARFLPEFLNRIDETIVFHPLDKKHIRRIVDIQVKRLVKQAEKAGITLECTDAALDEIARLGYDPVYGARPLKRVIQQQLQNELARELLSGKFPEGSTVRIDFVQDGFTFTNVA
ncbi:MAG: AAA family ATPase, partial [Planctomycetia bacterium]